MEPQKQEDNIHIGTFMRSGPRGRTKALIIAMVVAVVTASAFAVWWFTASRTTYDETASFNTAQQMKNSGDFGGAAAYSAEQYASSKSDNEKYILALQAASSYESKKDFKNAIDWYKKAAVLKERDMASAGGLGRSYDGIGDKKQAAVHYQQAIDWHNPSDPIQVQNDVPQYRELLQKAKAQ
jgi:Flp pilus assembly protein TadD